MNLNVLNDHRNEILWWEFCAWLHDVGKLSKEFLHYRQTWHLEERGYSTKDPHDSGWFDWRKTVADKPTRDFMIEEFPLLRDFFSKALIDSPKIAGALSVVNAVNSHVNPTDQLGWLLKAGDSADSKYDRNNPLYSCEQTNHSDMTSLPGVYRSDVFGYEGADASERLVTGDLLDSLRRALYTELRDFLGPLLSEPAPALDSWDAYCKLRAVFSKQFEKAMSDTTRPGNDTSLWEHTYSVATITKAAHAQYILSGESVPESWFAAKFHLVGVGVNSLAFLSSSHKLADVAARTEVIGDFFNAIAKRIEFSWAMGNEVYRDSSRVVFLIAQNVKPEELYEFFDGDAWDGWKGELAPHYQCTTNPVANLTHIVKVLDDLERSFAVPIRHFPQKLADSSASLWKGFHGHGICPICRLRPAVTGSPKVCRECMNRRQRQNRSLRQSADRTLFLEDIAGSPPASTGRLAAVIARFGLREWLSGRMIRTCFVTESRGVRKLLQILDKVKDLNETSLKDAGFIEWRRQVLDSEEVNLEVAFDRALEDKDPNYWTPIFSEFGCVSEKYQLGVAYDGKVRRRGLKALQDIQRELEEDYGSKSVTFEARVNAACAKTPTPSTTLDVWQTAQEFFESVAAADLFGRGVRIAFAIDPIAGVHDGESLDDCEIDGQPRPMFYRELKDPDRAYLLTIGRHDPINGVGRARFTSQDGRSHSVTLGASGVASADLGLTFVRARTVICSPDFLMILVPAESAIPFTRLIHEEYRKRLGKVMGRLPLSVANIFFDRYTPMFSVVDAARRIVENFDRLHREPQIEILSDARLAASLVSTLPSGEVDYHHPYLLTALPSASEPSWVPAVHVSDSLDKKVFLYPNYYDCIWLGSSGDRFSAFLDTSSLRNPVKREALRDQMNRTRGAVGESLVPILLEDLQAKVEKLWESLTAERISGSTLRNLEHTLVAKRALWRPHSSAGGAADFHSFAESVVRATFRSTDLRTNILNAINENYFELTLNLYLRILKQPLEGDR